MTLMKDEAYTPLYRQKDREFAVAGVCADILGNARNELYLQMRFLDVALSTLLFGTGEHVVPAGTDGIHLYFDPDALIRLFRMGRLSVNRLYLHIVFHCVFGHPWNRKGRDIPLWNLASDIADEWVIDSLSVRCVRRPPSSFRRSVYRLFSEEENGKFVPTAGRIFHILSERKDDTVFLDRLAGEFTVDDHRLWNEEVSKKPQESRQRWEDIRERMQTEVETFSREASDDVRALAEQLEIENHKRYDYREFLRRFSVWKEEMRSDLDSFDYIYYHFGMELYGNTPLIEPLETKEVRKIEDFVIVIDTSMSCRENLVRAFVEETCTLLQESESFFRRIHIHIIQCDDRVREDRVIHDQAELRDYMDHFELKGLGGTDFRPAFAYIAELLRQGDFTHLRGLLYFTDGYGTFPHKKPPYDTAFVFMREQFRDVDVPPWAMKLILDEEDLTKH